MSGLEHKHVLELFPPVLYTSHTSLTLQDEYQALQLALTTAETSLSSVKRENDTLVVQLMALKVCFYSMSLGYIRERGGVYDALLGKRQILFFDTLSLRGNSDNYSYTPF